MPEDEDAGEEEQELKKIEEISPHEKELIKELETAKKQLEEADKKEKELVKELDANRDTFLRLSAEFDNFRKIAKKEKEEFVKYANEKLILELIEIYENLERALENTKNGNNKDKLIEGMELIYKQFKNVLEKNGLMQIKALGEKFDPYKHEAIMITQTDEYDEDTILEEFARGYMLNNKVIRYSKVRVAKKEAKEEEVK